MKKTFLLIYCLMSWASFAQIKSGPMLGYSDMREVLLWVQTEKAAKVKFVYWEEGNPTQRFTTEEVKTEKNTAFVAKCIADEVLPSKKYNYEVFVNGKKQTFNYPLSFQSQTLWQYRTDPPNFKVAIGSCTYTPEERFDRPGKPYGSEFEIFTSIYKQKPDLMIWGGDNIYLREADWNTRTGILHRYSHFRAIPEIQPLLANTHHYALWDDHDYGPNNPDRSFWMKNTSLEAFKLFWGNPNYVFKDEGITGTFFWNDVQFFVMDDNFWRAPNERSGKDRDYWGKKQTEWLIDALRFSNAPFKVILNGGQVINPAKIWENYANYETERQYVLETIKNEKISGVFFISGDRHHTNLQKLDREGTYPLYDLTVSPLTSGSGSPAKEEYLSKSIVEGTEVNQKHSFGTLEFSGIRTDRVMKINIFDKDGKELWTKEIRANELK